MENWSSENYSMYVDQFHAVPWSYFFSSEEMSIHLQEYYIYVYTQRQQQRQMLYIMIVWN